MGILIAFVLLTMFWAWVSNGVAKSNAEIKIKTPTGLQHVTERSERFWVIFFGIPLALLVIATPFLLVGLLIALIV